MANSNENSHTLTIILAILVLAFLVSTCSDNHSKDSKTDKHYEVYLGSL